MFEYFCFSLDVHIIIYFNRIKNREFMRWKRCQPSKCSNVINILKIFFRIWNLPYSFAARVIIIFVIIWENWKTLWKRLFEKKNMRSYKELLDSFRSWCDAIFISDANTYTAKLLPIQNDYIYLFNYFVIKLKKYRWVFR